jgi:hypothetical protein
VLFQFIKQLLPKQHRQQKPQLEQHKLSTKKHMEEQNHRKQLLLPINKKPSYEPPSNSDSSNSPLQYTLKT